MVCPVCQSSRSVFVHTVTDYISRENFNLQKCKECSLIYIEHPPELEDMPRYYENSAGETMQKNPGQTIFRWMHDLRLFADVSPLLRRVKRGSRLLDLGTGTGELAQFLSERGYKVQGVDYYPLEQWPHPSTSYKQLNLSRVAIGPEELLWDGDCPTGVILRHSLEHLHHPKELFQTLSRTKIQFILVIVPNAASRLRFMFGRHWYYWDPPRHLIHFTFKSLERLGENTGYRIVERSSYGIDEIVTSLYSRFPSGWPGTLFQPKGTLAALSSALSTFVSNTVCCCLFERTS